MNGKIGNVQAGFMIGTALLFDGIQAATKILHFIPGFGNILAVTAGWLISVCAWMTFNLWLALNGINPFRVKRMLALGGGGIVEMIPIINALPAWTATITFMLIKRRVKKYTPLGHARNKLKSKLRTS